MSSASPRSEIFPDTQKAVRLELRVAALKQLQRETSYEVGKISDEARAVFYLQTRILVCDQRIQELKGDVAIEDDLLTKKEIADLEAEIVAYQREIERRTPWSLRVWNFDEQVQVLWLGKLLHDEQERLEGLQKVGGGILVDEDSRKAVLEEVMVRGLERAIADGEKKYIASLKGQIRLEDREKRREFADSAESAAKARAGAHRDDFVATEMKAEMIEELAASSQARQVAVSDSAKFALRAHDLRMGEYSAIAACAKQLDLIEGRVRVIAAVVSPATGLVDTSFAKTRKAVQTATSALLLSAPDAIKADDGDSSGSGTSQSGMLQQLSSVHPYEDALKNIKSARIALDESWSSLFIAEQVVDEGSQLSGRVLSSASDVYVMYKRSESDAVKRKKDYDEGGLAQDKSSTGLKSEVDFAVRKRLCEEAKASFCSMRETYITFLRWSRFEEGFAQKRAKLQQARISLQAEEQRLCAMEQKLGILDIGCRLDRTIKFLEAKQRDLQSKQEKGDRTAKRKSAAIGSAVVGLTKIAKEVKGCVSDPEYVGARDQEFVNGIFAIVVGEDKYDLPDHSEEDSGKSMSCADMGSTPTSTSTPAPAPLCEVFDDRFPEEKGFVWNLKTFFYGVWKAFVRPAALEEHMHKGRVAARDVVKNVAQDLSAMRRRYAVDFERRERQSVTDGVGDSVDEVARPVEAVGASYSHVQTGEEDVSDTGDEHKVGTADEQKADVVDDDFMPGRGYGLFTDIS